MARVKFKGKDEDETFGGGGNKFPAAPRGIYTVQIADYEAKVCTSAKNHGVPMYNLTCEIAEGEYKGTRLWHTLTLIPRGTGEKAAAGHGIAVHFLHSLGIESSNGEFDFDDSEFQAKQFRALLEIDTYSTERDGKQYINEKNVVREIYSAKHPEPAELPPLPKAKAQGSARPANGTHNSKTPVGASVGGGEAIDPDLGF